MRIYTRTGDDGITGLFSGRRVAKTDPCIEACGAIDELNSLLGVALSRDPAEPVGVLLRRLQSELFALGADLAADAAAAPLLEAGAVRRLEEDIDRMTAELAPLRRFVLPGGSPAAAEIHLARAVCRRVERRVLPLAPPGAETFFPLVYLNRLSDFLFTLARYENHLRGVAEPEWVSGSTP